MDGARIIEPLAQNEQVRMKTAKFEGTSSFGRWTSDTNKIGDESQFQWFPPVAKVGQVSTASVDRQDREARAMKLKASNTRARSKPERLVCATWQDQHRRVLALVAGVVLITCAGCQSDTFTCSKFRERSTRLSAIAFLPPQIKRA